VKSATKINGRIMKNILMGILIGLGLSTVVWAKQLPELPVWHEGMICHAEELNAVVLHIQELERKVAGMQKQITILHGKFQEKQ
jgi:hypothetical protein